MKALLLKALDALRYPSTWKGIITLLASAGVALKPELAEAIGTAGVALVGVIWLVFSDADVAKKK